MSKKLNLISSELVSKHDTGDPCAEMRIEDRRFKEWQDERAQVEARMKKELTQSTLTEGQLVLTNKVNSGSRSPNGENLEANGKETDANSRDGVPIGNGSDESYAKYLTTCGIPCEREDTREDDRLYDGELEVDALELLRCWFYRDSSDTKEPNLETPTEYHLPFGDKGVDYQNDGY
ncbi:hypothetical protein FRX31_033513 [Thalictrum thalictroides]|uniref:Uncharacterized protein n=1 Tax=Thalictrum thalictroides TaxID=46969 RepID=A0A7J6UWM3_THATH|nr:hypothetical protein FRX31_033513 [Thalictrum thalictroides]